MAVRPRSNGYQADFSFKGKRYRKDGFSSQLEAETWERDTVAALRDGKPLSGATNAQERPSTMRALCDRVCLMVWKGKRSEDTAVKNAEDCVKLLGEKRDPRSVTTSAIDHMIEEWKRAGLSNATINRKLAALSKMLHFAKQRDWLPSVPHLPRLRENEHRIRWMSDEEEKKVVGWFRHIGRETMADLVEFLLDTGLRVNEALGLEWGMVEEGWVRVPPELAKSGKARSVPMTPRVKALVEKRRKASPKDTLGLFHDLDYWQANYAWDQMRAHFKLDGDPQFVIHMLRHTFCSRLVQRGRPIQEVQALAGHKTITVTMRYAHLAPENLLKAIEVLS